MVNTGSASSCGGSVAQQTNDGQRAADNVQQTNDGQRAADNVLAPTAHADVCQDQSGTGVQADYIPAENPLTESQQPVMDSGQEVAETNVHEESVTNTPSVLADSGTSTNKHVSQLQPIN
ncbi:hypothetical protein V6N13_075301 [Hibiscus sabdariffa]|uniref:Uncharacterized protein n=1 Tax=Hibiscus sabdariffa TaxID=183260 RepID=A0ABR2UBR5_9ROSI